MLSLSSVVFDGVVVTSCVVAVVYSAVPVIVVVISVVVVVGGVVQCSILHLGSVFSFTFSILIFHSPFIERATCHKFRIYGNISLA